MKLLLPLIYTALITTVGAGLVKNVAKPPRFYHEEVGIAAAERIRRAEETVGSGGPERIVGGSLAAVGDFPYMGGLVITLTSGEISMCGSSLLSHTRLVTAAHCWWDGRHQARQFVVVLGSTLLFSGGVRITAIHVEMHPSWNTATLASNLAMISINHVTFTDAIAPVALPNGEERLKDFANWWAVAIGYGMTTDSASGVINQSLSHVRMLVMPHSTCTALAPQATATMLCADSNIAGRGVCSGDAGGPLVYTDGIRPMLISIASFWYENCSNSRHPAVFTRITSFRNWINRRI